MVSIPDFDPNIFARGITQKEWNELSQNPLKPMVNLAISVIFHQDLFLKWLRLLQLRGKSYK